jgi:pimeloyl-ACP methyl ester carboxylesterase
MKRSELILAAFGLALLAWGALWIESAHGPMRDVTINGGPACPAAPVLILEPATGSPRGSVVVFHGLGANRIVMLTGGQQFAAAGFRVYLVDSPGHGADTAPFSFAANEACARGLLATLERRGEITARRTILFGHSMGAALAVRLADDFPAAATIAVSTAPLVPPHRLPANLLLVAPQWDMPPVLRTETQLAAAAGAPRYAPTDFLQLRAFRLLCVPRRTHTGALFDLTAMSIMLRWALDSVGAAAAPVPAPNFRAFAGGWLGLLGILFLFPASATAITRISGSREPSLPPPRPALSALYLMAALVLAAIISARWNPLSPLHLYSADYLASILVLAGLPLAVGASRWRNNSSLRSSLSPSPRSSSSPFSPPICATILALLAVLAAGTWLNWQLAEFWLIPARWARFPFLLLALLPACYAEEHALGDPASLSRATRAGRILLFFVFRGLVWLVLFGAWLAGVSGALLAVIFGAFLALLSLAQRLGADAVRRRTGSALAAAIFNAILGAWFLAAVFPLA